MNSGQQQGGHAYEPSKCESPIEREVAWVLPKRLKRETVIEQQAWLVGADGKNYRADFLIKREGRTIGIECDGKNYHDLDRDEARDAAILMAGDVHAIYRFRGQDIFYRLDDLFYLLWRYEPDFFSEHSAQIVQTLASAEVKEQAEWWDRAGAVINYPMPGREDRSFELVMFRRTAEMFAKEAA